MQDPFEIQDITEDILNKAFESKDEVIEIEDDDKSRVINKPRTDIKLGAIDEKDLDAAFTNEDLELNIDENEKDEENLISPIKPEKVRRGEKDPTYKALYEGFVDLGLLDQDEAFDGSENGFVEAFKKKETKIKEEMYSQIEEELSPEGIQLIKHLKSGGALEDFVEAYSDPLKKVDLETEDGQIATLRHFYELQGSMDEDEIEEEIQAAIQLNKLEAKAIKAFDKISAYKTAKQKELEEINQENEQKRQNSVTKIENSIKNVIKEKSQVYGLPIAGDAVAKRELEDYIFKKVVRLPNGSYVSRYYADLQKDKDNYEAYVLKAYLTKNQYKLDNVKRSAETAATLNLKKRIEDVKKETSGPSLLKGRDSNQDRSKSKLDFSKNLFV